MKTANLPSQLWSVHKLGSKKNTWYIKIQKPLFRAAFFMLDLPIFILIKNNPLRHGAYKIHNATSHS